MEDAQSKLDVQNYAFLKMKNLEAQVKKLKEEINEWYRIDLLQVYSGPDDEASFHRSQLLDIKKLFNQSTKETK